MTVCGDERAEPVFLRTELPLAFSLGGPSLCTADLWHPCSTQQMGVVQHQAEAIDKTEQ